MTFLERIAIQSQRLDEIDGMLDMLETLVQTRLDEVIGLEYSEAIGRLVKQTVDPPELVDDGARTPFFSSDDDGDGPRFQPPDD